MNCNFVSAKRVSCSSKCRGKIVQPTEARTGAVGHFDALPGADLPPAGRLGAVAGLGPTDALTGVLQGQADLLTGLPGGPRAPSPVHWGGGRVQTWC